jgi:hypothetical protein
VTGLRHGSGVGERAGYSWLVTRALKVRIFCLRFVIYVDCCRDISDPERLICKPGVTLGNLSSSAPEVHPECVPCYAIGSFIFLRHCENVSHKQLLLGNRCVKPAFFFRAC